MTLPDSACVQSRDCELRRCAEDFAAAIERNPDEWKDAAHWLLEGHPPDSSQDRPIVGQLTIKCAELVRDAFGSQSPDRHLRQFGLEEATRVGLITALLADKDFDGGCVGIPWPWSAGEQGANDRETAQLFALDNLPGSAWYRNVDDIWLTLVREAITVLDKKRPRWRGDAGRPTQLLVPSGGISLTLDDLSHAERTIIEAIGTKTLIGEKLAKTAGYPCNSNFKSTLSSLRKRGILGNKAPGYFLNAECHYLLALCKGQDMAKNPLRIIPKLDERKDRRRVRRAVSNDELVRLLDAAGPRRLVYLTAAMTGLRRGELRKITWGDIDLADGYLRVRIGVGKAAREDFVPMHEQVIEALTEAKPADAKPVNRVFPTMPTIRTFYLDLERARTAWITEADDDADERQRREESDVLAKVDSAGRWVDLHAMRTTLSTNLAKAGVMPQLAQRVMRHSDMRTTLRYYTDLRLADATKAVDALPRIQVASEANRAAATGTYGDDAVAGQETPGAVDSTGAESCTPNRAFPVTTVHDRNDAALETVDAQPVGNAPCCTTKRDDSSKRAKGLEPSTFSPPDWPPRRRGTTSTRRRPAAHP